MIIEPRTSPDRSGKLVEFAARRWPSLAGIGLTVVFAVALPDSPWVGRTALIAATAAYPVAGLLRHHLHGRKTIALQAAALAAFTTAAVATPLMDPGTARILLAATWFAHALWDLAHHRADRMVPRWYAEGCAVIDTLTALSLLLL
ncbi:hypothetical protein [Nocardia sp. NPDC052566]|uniref:hypothetical protein n=1 Tax=Nocardia sp. NPDC052566 TaxID=3364330 RepID=UPI0037C6806A